MNQEELKKLDKCIKDTDTALFSVGKKVLITRLLIGAVLIGGFVAKPIYPESVQQTMNQGINHIDKVLSTVNRTINNLAADQLHNINSYFRKVLDENPTTNYKRSLATAMIYFEADTRASAKNKNPIDFTSKDVPVLQADIEEKNSANQKKRLKEVQDIKKELVTYKTKFILMAKHDKHFNQLENKGDVAKILFQKNIPIEESLTYIKNNPKVVFEKPNTDKEIIGYKIEEKKSLSHDNSSIINKVKSLAGLKNTMNKEDNNKIESAPKNKVQ